MAEPSTSTVSIYLHNHHFKSCMYLIQPPKIKLLFLSWVLNTNLVIFSMLKKFQGSGLHPYVSQNPQLKLSEAVPMINDWKGSVGLIIEMEMAMKSRGLLPSIDNPKNTIFLKFEWQFFGITASKLFGINFGFCISRLKKKTRPPLRRPGLQSYY